MAQRQRHRPGQDQGRAERCGHEGRGAGRGNHYGQHPGEEGARRAGQARQGAVSGALKRTSFTIWISISSSACVWETADSSAAAEIAYQNGVAYAGDRRVFGFRGEVMGDL